MRDMIHSGYRSNQRNKKEAHPLLHHYLWVLPSAAGSHRISLFLHHFEPTRKAFPYSLTFASPSTTMLSRLLTPSAVKTRFCMASSRFFSSDTVTKGSVKWFDTKKGFGFIAPEDGSGDVFVHQSVIHADGFRSLRDGEPVEFATELDGMTGRIRAVKVTGPKGAYVQGASRRSPPSFGMNDGYRFDRRPKNSEYDGGLDMDFDDVFDDEKKRS